MKFWPLSAIGLNTLKKWLATVTDIPSALCYQNIRILTLTYSNSSSIIRDNLKVAKQGCGNTKILNISLLVQKKAEMIQCDYGEFFSVICKNSDELLTLVKKRKLRWFGHVSRSSGLAKTILQGTGKEKRKRVRQKKRWEDNIKE